jgi:hypothetical protein
MPTKIYSVIIQVPGQRRSPKLSHWGRDSVLPVQGYRTSQLAVTDQLAIGSNDGMMSGRGKPKKLGEKFAPVPLRPPGIIRWKSVFICLFIIY